MFEEKRKQIESEIEIHYVKGNKDRCFLSILLLISEQLTHLIKSKEVPTPTVAAKPAKKFLNAKDLKGKK